MNDRDLRLRCVELAAAMFANSPGLDAVQTADKLFLYVSAGNAAKHAVLDPDVAGRDC